MKLFWFDRLFELKFVHKIRPSLMLPGQRHFWTCSQEGRNVLRARITSRVKWRDLGVRRFQPIVLVREHEYIYSGGINSREIFVDLSAVFQERGNIRLRNEISLCIPYLSPWIKLFLSMPFGWKREKATLHLTCELCELQWVFH